MKDEEIITPRGNGKDRFVCGKKQINGQLNINEQSEKKEQCRVLSFK